MDKAAMGDIAETIAPGALRPFLEMEGELPHTGVCTI